MFMWYFEYSYDSTAVLNPKRSMNDSANPSVDPEAGTTYWFGGRMYRL